MDIEKFRAQAIWISWQDHRRTETLVNALGITLVVIKSSKNSVIRYPYSVFKTLATLIKARPKYLFVQNPSLVLSALAVLWSKLFGVSVVVDAHNAGVAPWPGSSRLTQLILSWVLKHATLTIVTNATLAVRVETYGGHPQVLPDLLPALAPNTSPKPIGAATHVVLICTYSHDEPISTVIEAARRMPGVAFSITGKPKAGFNELELPINVRQTGFLPDDEYIALLSQADLIIDLTTRDACIVCGAYEATALAKPVMLSDNASTMALFPEALYCDNTITGVIDAVSRFIDDPARWNAGAVEMREVRQLVEKMDLQELQDKLASLVSPSGHARHP